MLSKKSLAVGLICMMLAVAATPVLAQSSMDPGNYSSQQFVDTESPAVQSAPQTVLSRPDFRLLAMSLLWPQMAWAPASPMFMPSALSLLAPGDRRWGLR